jgi:hypothetical protein
MDETQLENLIDMSSNTEIIEEIQTVLKLAFPNSDSTLIKTGFQTTLDLYQRRFPGYQACSTYYHDLHHSLSTGLTIARLIHGATLDGFPFTSRQFSLAVVCAFFHDAGFIQEEHDKEGTGAKYTVNHVPRSMDFLAQYGPVLGLTDEEIANGRVIILCTDLAVAIPSIQFSSESIALLGKLLNAADLMAQMAERIYLEKLLFLFHEFKEGNVNGFEGEVDLLRKTMGFYDVVSTRFDDVAEKADRYLRLHFTARWELDSNLYQEAILRQKNYLQEILSIPDADPRDHLRRRSVVRKVRQKFGYHN